MSSLLHFIRSHGHQAEPGSNGRIRVVVTFTQHGTLFHRIELIPATAGAVRAWLGY